MSRVALNAAAYMLLLFTTWVVSIEAKQFHDYSFNELSTMAQELDGPFAAVQSADQLWGHKDLRSSHCSAQVIRVTETERLQPAPRTPPDYLHSLKSSDMSLPQVVISGEIHGNERVGPVASLFTAQLLVWASMCSIKKIESHCAHLRNDLLVTDEEITWLTFLATRRDTFVLPTPNCQGYIRKVRSDEGVDTNRDFSYSREDNNCFITTTTKIFQALFSTVSVQILVTFHGGMVALGYEWGSMDHPRGKDFSPDHRAHRDIAQSMAKFGGSFKGAKAYVAKPINSIVYPVHGGMEDWAYAAGWDTARVRTDCKDGGFPLPQTAVTGEGKTKPIPNNRAVTFLVETSDQKSPRAVALGYDKNVLVNEEESNQKFGGHVPRNVRLALAAIDFVEPYVCFSAVKPPQSHSSGGLRVQWYVGGASTVDKTWLSWHRSAPKRGHDVEGGLTVEASSVLSGQAKWGVPTPLAIDASHEGRFVADVMPPPSHLLDAGESTLWLVAHAVVDQKWGASGQGHPHDLGPQSHLVQMRTNSSYKASSFAAFNSKDIRLHGRTEWLSDAMEVAVGAINTGSAGSSRRFLRGKKRGKGRTRKARKTGQLGGETEALSAMEGERSLNVKSSVLHCAWWSRQ